LGFVQSLLRYAAFYLTTSSWWDAGRAVGNVVLVISFGGPVIRLLQRFRQRFDFQLEGSTGEGQISS
jgi:energy-coupling factor transport system substrate-specific component